MCAWQIDESQLRRLLSLLRTIFTPIIDTQARWQKTVDKLCELIGASEGFCGIMSFASRRPRLETIFYPGRSNNALYLMQQWLDHHAVERSGTPMFTMLRASSASLWHMRQQVAASEEKPETFRAFAEIHDNCIYSLLMMNDSQAALLCIAQPRGQKVFTQTDALLVQIVHEQMQAMYQTSFQPRSAAMTPRQREIHHFLLKGHAEKQIASQLQLSRHTVHAHVKAIYRHFQVSSRPELLAQFIRA